MERFEPFSMARKWEWDPNKTPTERNKYYWNIGKQGDYVWKDQPPRDDEGRYTGGYVHGIIQMVQNHGKEQVELALGFLERKEAQTKKQALFNAAKAVGERLARKKGATPWKNWLDEQATPHMHAFAQVHSEINAQAEEIGNLFKRVSGKDNANLNELTVLLSHWREGGIQRVRFAVEQAEQGKGFTAD
ncbi:hypothetical protein HY994_02020 [Candidatus Micrarchaeota archaeon]|nr:hypothetical protein [Candidatus Micrarchaeota archaeon]